MVLQFIIFGTKTRTKEHGPAYPSHCSHCENDAYMHAGKWRTWFHIFWVPLIPWFATRALVCPICGMAWELNRTEYSLATDLAATVEAVESGTATPDELYDSLEAFETELGIDTAVEPEEAELVEERTDRLES